MKRKLLVVIMAIAISAELLAVAKDALPPHLLVYNKGTKCYRWVGDKSKCIEVTIPKGVTSIGDWAFYECGSLTNITIPKGVTSISKSTFTHCSSLKNIIIPEGVTSIGDQAFEDCRFLTSITIPESVTSIGEDAFSSCDKLPPNAQSPMLVTPSGI